MSLSICCDILTICVWFVFSFQCLRIFGIHEQHPLIIAGVDYLLLSVCYLQYVTSMLTIHPSKEVLIPIHNTICIVSLIIDQISIFFLGSKW